MALNSQMNADRRKLEIGARWVYQLRSNVKRLFNDLILVPSSSSTDSAEERVQSAHKTMLAIQKSMSDIEKLSASLEGDKSEGGRGRLGNLGLLSLDPAPESTDLHQRALKVFHGTKRSQELLTSMTTALVRNDLKTMSSLEPYAMEPPAKVCRPLFSSEHIQRNCEEWNKEHTKLHLTHHGLPSGLHVIKGDITGVLTAYIQLGSELLPFAVNVHEWRPQAEPSLPDADQMCSESPFKVFQEVTTCCKLHLLSITAAHRCTGVLVLNDFLEWLQAYHTLFSDVCTVCKRQLSQGGCAEGPLPPCWHDLKDIKGTATWAACHRSCRSP